MNIPTILVHGGSGEIPPSIRESNTKKIYLDAMQSALDAGYALLKRGDSVLEEAAEKVIADRLKNLGGEGGLIAVDARGNIALPFNSEGMYRGMKNEHRTFTKIL